MADLEIKVGANVAAAIAGLNDVQSELGQTGKAAAQLGNEVEKASSKILKLPSVTNQATFTLNNFTRVVQDAPYGIRGVANNIDPLVESFSRLKIQTGSTGLAIKAMLNTLAGPAGVLLAVSTVTTLLVQFSDKLFSTSAAAKAAAQANQELAESFSSEFVQLTSLVGLAQSNSASLADRKNALAALNQEYAKYLPNLGQEGITLNNLNESYKKITDTLLNQAVVKGLQAEIAKEVEKVASQIIKLVQQRERDRIGLNQNVKDTKVAISAEKQLENAIARKNAIITDGFIAQNRNNQNIRAAIGTTDVYTILIENLKKQLFDTVAPALKLASSFDVLNENLKKGKDEQYKLEFLPGFSKLTLELDKQAGALPNLLDKLRQVAKIINKDIKTDDKLPKRFDLDLDINEKSIEFRKQLEENGKAAQNAINTINEAFLNIQLEGLALIGQTIGLALTNGNIKQAFDNFGLVIANGLEIIGKQLIVIGGLTELVQKALKGLFGPQGGPAAIAAGIALIAAGTALRSSLSQGIQARALGGPVSGGNPYLVGERGPELFVPSVSGSIVPNNSVGSFMGGRMGDSGRGTTLRGQDIILAYARTQRSQLRVNG